MDTKKEIQELRDNLQELMAQCVRDRIQLFSHCIAIQRGLADLSSDIRSKKTGDVSSAQKEKFWWEEMGLINKSHKEIMDQCYCKMEDVIPPGIIAGIDNREPEDMP